MGRLTSFLAGLAFIGSTAVTRAECAGTKFKSLVQFGDSYTDMARLHYFVTHNGTAPPVGWEQPDVSTTFLFLEWKLGSDKQQSNNTRSGGYIWGHYVSEWANVNVYDYAVSGAVCSNKITPKPFPILGRNFPSVAEYEIPAFLADSEYTTPSGDKFLDIPPEETVYSMWIGTNDLGVFLTGDQTPGKTIVDYLDCVYSALDRVYENGGRNFILMNVIPLQLTPEYATRENHGVGPNLYWPDKPVDKMTVKSYEMFAEVTIANDLYRFRTPVEVLFANRYPGASFAVMDTHRLVRPVIDSTAWMRILIDGS